MTDNIDFLTIVYEDYCTKHSLPFVSADEQDTVDMDQKHVQWLVSFNRMWELAQDSWETSTHLLVSAPFSCILKESKKREQMQLTNSVCIVDFFPEAFIAEACEDKGMKVVVKRFIKRVTFANDYGADQQTWSVVTASTYANEVASRLAQGAEVTGFNTDKCPDSYTPCFC